MKRRSSREESAAFVGPRRRLPSVRHRPHLDGRAATHARSAAFRSARVRSVPRLASVAFSARAGGTGRSSGCVRSRACTRRRRARCSDPTMQTRSGLRYRPGRSDTARVCRAQGRRPPAPSWPLAARWQRRALRGWPLLLRHDLPGRRPREQRWNRPSRPARERARCGRSWTQHRRAVARWQGAARACAQRIAAPRALGVPASGASPALGRAASLPLAAALLEPAGGGLPAG